LDSLQTKSLAKKYKKDYQYQNKRQVHQTIHKVIVFVFFKKILQFHTHQFLNIVKFMKKILLIVFTFFAFTVNAQSAEDKQQILNILDRQTQAWNNGDTENFMKGYWESDSLMYIGKTGVTYGYKSTLARYKENYPNKAMMGTLKFDIIKVNFMSKDACLVVGKWHLTRPEKGDVGGHYTLIWRKINNEWVIVADHSS
jgi:hypothetical protein